jgi:hypothetical protein
MKPLNIFIENFKTATEGLNVLVKLFIALFLFFIIFAVSFAIFGVVQSL